MQRAEFPVDTHVWRISRNQGWAPKHSTRETCYTHMNTRVPDKLKYDLHCLLVTHGKRCISCAATSTSFRDLFSRFSRVFLSSMYAIRCAPSEHYVLLAYVWPILAYFDILGLF